MLQTLIDHQERIGACIGRGEALLRNSTTPDIRMLATQRWELTRLLTAYRLFKHTELFNRATARGSQEAVLLAGQMRSRCDAISADLETYVRRWQAACVTKEWAAYKHAALAMADRLRRHLRREREDAGRLCQAAKGVIRTATVRPGTDQGTSAGSASSFSAATSRLSARLI